MPFTSQGVIVQYNKLFDQKATNAKLKKQLAKLPARLGDRRDGLVYLYTDEIELTVNVGLATGRPILLRGPSGSGKSSLAKNVALRLGRRYYEEVITSKTQYTDLLWHFDLLRRFRDAGANQLKRDSEYIEPRAFWWAFDPDLATRRGLPAVQTLEQPAKDPSSTDGEDAVVLIDEIDKADPDVPNNLLVTIGSAQFTVPYLNDLLVEAKGKTPDAEAVPPLVFITSNDERDLPSAFLRRCVTLELQAPSPERLVDIAAEHFGDKPNERKEYQSIVDSLYADGAKNTSTAEYLDTVRACRQLDVQPKPGDPVWDTIVRITVRKAATAARPGE
jgi:MoxR-like ATPase